jgi:hypothetical protein
MELKNPPNQLQQKKDSHDADDKVTSTATNL